MPRTPRGTAVSAVCNVPRLPYTLRSYVKGQEVILDNIFAALDPRTLEQCLPYSTARSATLLVIA